jgi:hypothetical protein
MQLAFGVNGTAFGFNLEVNMRGTSGGPLVNDGSDGTSCLETGDFVLLATSVVILWIIGLRSTEYKQKWAFTGR